MLGERLTVPDIVGFVVDLRRRGLRAAAAEREASEMPE